jgi:hypothetical protein
MGRYWLRVRAEYVVPVLATSREDALGLEPGDLVDDLTAERLYSAELLSASPDSERAHLGAVAESILDAEQRAEHDVDLAMLEVGAAVREHFQHVRGIPRETLEAHVEDVIRGIADEIAREHIAEGDDDWQARRAALAAGIGKRAASSAKAYTKWRTENE